MAHRTEIMWIERKSDGLVGPARIGRVTFSKSGRSLHYGDKTFDGLKRRGFKANYVDVATGEEFWISGCHKDGNDALYSTTVKSMRMSGKNIGRRFATNLDKPMLRP